MHEYFLVIQFLQEFGNACWCITPSAFFDCFKAGSLSRDQSPSNADTLDPCQPFPLPDHLFFDETSAAGRLYRYCLCCTPIYMYIIILKTACLTVLVSTFQLKVNTLFLYQMRSIQLSRNEAFLSILGLHWILWTRLIRSHCLPLWIWTWPM